MGGEEWRGGGEQEHLEKGGEVGAEVEDEETGSGGGEARGAGDAKGDAITYVRTHRILFGWHLRMRGVSLRVTWLTASDCTWPT